MNITEQAIITDCQSGNTERFAELYDTYVNKIYKFIYFKTFHKETAEDLTSEVFFKALKNIDKVDTSLKFSSWLYKVAQNTVIDHYRKEKKLVNIEDVWDIGDDNKFTNKLNNQIEFKEIKKHLSILSPDQRNIVVMRVWHDLSYKEIAGIMGKREDNCKVIFSRAVKDLRKVVPIISFIILSLKI